MPKFKYTAFKKEHKEELRNIESFLIATYFVNCFDNKYQFDKKEYKRMLTKLAKKYHVSKRSVYFYLVDKYSH